MEVANFGHLDRSRWAVSWQADDKTVFAFSPFFISFVLGSIPQNSITPILSCTSFIKMKCPELQGEYLVSYFLGFCQYVWWCIIQVQRQKRLSGYCYNYTDTPFSHFNWWIRLMFVLSSDAQIQTRNGSPIDVHIKKVQVRINGMT